MADIDIMQKENLQKLDLESDEPNEICKECLFWKSFQKKCYVYWHKKKYCTMRVSDSGEFEEKKTLLNIS
jgi:hypothetical protein